MTDEEFNLDLYTMMLNAATILTSDIPEPVARRWYNQPPITDQLNNPDD
jgi:hypothetical protein